MAKTILVVDDSRIVREISEFILTSAGHRVYTASGGFEALEILQHQPIDMLFVDINMPGMDGFTLIEKIREQEKFALVPIVIATTEAEAHDKARGFDAGADAYMVKPILPEEMLAHVEMLVGG